MVERKKITKEFECKWCHVKFKREIGVHIDNEPSTQIKCPNGHGVETFEKEFTGNVVGRKHIHRR